MLPIHSVLEPGAQAPACITIAVMGIGFLHLFVSNFSSINLGKIKNTDQRTVTSF